MADRADASEPVVSSQKASGRNRKLPSRLFATDRYPDGRVNVYSRPDILTVARRVLENTSQWDKLINSQFGYLFSLPIGRCPHYGQLLHALVCRQLLTRKKYEMWTVFGGHPLRFSLFEFGSVSGLSCGEFPQGYDFDFQIAPTAGQKYYWNSLIGKDMKTTIADVSKKLQDQPTMDVDLKLKLVLLLIVDEILIATHQTHKPTLKYVEMLEDVDKFLAFPWGREPFLKTLATLKAPPARSAKEEGVKSFAQQLKQQQTFRAQGFPLALQLLALQNISGLLPNTLAASESRKFLQWPFLGIPKHSFSRADVHAVERDDSLSVDPLVYVDLLPEDGWGQWDDEERDKRVEHMMKLISKGHTFENSEWIGGDNSLDFINVVEKNPEQVHQKHVIVWKRKLSKNDQGSSSRRTSKRCKSNPPSEFDTLKELMQSQLEDMKQSLSTQLNQHSLEIKKLNRKYKYLKFKRARKFGSNSSFLSYRRMNNKQKNMSQQGSKSVKDAHHSSTPDGTKEPMGETSFMFFVILIAPSKSPSQKASLRLSTNKEYGFPCSRHLLKNLKYDECGLDILTKCGIRSNLTLDRVSAENTAALPSWPLNIQFFK